jgi:predicted RNA-binding protein with PIN domain
MVYILDGCNVLKRMQDLGVTLIRDNRESLLDFLLRYKPQGRNDVIVFFDGYGNISGNYGKIKVLFSRDISADEQILGFLKRGKEKQRYYLITDDRELGFKARNFNAKIIAVADFIGPVFKKKIRKDREKGEKIDPLSSQAYEINKELEDIWLRKKGSTG